MKTKTVLFSLALTAILLGTSSCTHGTATPATAVAQTSMLQLSGPEATPSSLRPYPEILTVETTEQGMASVVDAPPVTLNFFLAAHTLTLAKIEPLCYKCKRSQKESARQRPISLSVVDKTARGLKSFVLL